MLEVGMCAPNGRVDREPRKDRKTNNTQYTNNNNVKLENNVHMSGFFRKVAFYPRYYEFRVRIPFDPYGFAVRGTIVSIIGLPNAYWN